MKGNLEQLVLKSTMAQDWLSAFYVALPANQDYYFRVALIPSQGPDQTTSEKESKNEAVRWRRISLRGNRVF
jgi:hypothetical protein